MWFYMKVRVNLTPIIKAYLAIDPLPTKTIISAWYMGAQNYCRQHHQFEPSRHQIAQTLQSMGYKRILDHGYINWIETSAESAQEH